MEKNKNVYHVISNTHWDREWRFPFQRNRQMLVEMIDEALDILESDPDYRAYHLDSQSIVLRDYLEVKPYNKERIVQLVRENRLLIGPWYILPDEFQVGGENHVRNLLLGHKICKEFGGVSKIGYSPFSWGQISQLPQIYNDFRIELIMFYRGVNALEAPKSEFMWEGADGTKMVSSRFSTMPRYNFYFYIYRNAIHNEDPWNVEYKWSKGGSAFHFADKEQQEEDYFFIKKRNEYFPENIEYWVNRLREEQDNDFTTPHKIWMEGHDSSGPNGQTGQLIKDIKAQTGLDVRHSTLLEYAEAIAKSVKEDELNLVTGERRSAQANPRSGNMYGYTTSARMYLKQKNFDAERWTQFYAEQFNHFAGLLGKDTRDLYLDIAWEKILQNAAHDSIGGCSLDAIHEDMMHRYKEAIEISRGVFERAMKYTLPQLSTKVFTDQMAEDEAKVFISAINPNSTSRSEVVEAYLDMPKEFAQKGFELVDAEGSKVEYQLIKEEGKQLVVEEMTNRPMFFDMQRYKAYVHLQNVPAHGVKVFRLKPTEEAVAENAPLAVLEQRPVLENEFLKVEVNENGSFNIHSKTNGVQYKEVGYIYDEGEAGHAWVNTPTEPFVTSLNAKPSISIIENGALSSTVEIAFNLDLYNNLADRKALNGNTTECAIVLKATLNKGSKNLEFNLEVDNRVESHRLRIMFPTQVGDNAFSYGEGQFDVVKRSLERPDTSDWVEQPMYDFPMHQFVDVADDKNGVALLVDGLKEYEVLQDEQKTLAITLIRSFEFIINPAAEQDYTHEKGAQCLGKQNFRMAFYPHTGNWGTEEANVYQEALNFNNTLRLVQTGELEGELGTEVSFLNIENKNVVFSAFKGAENPIENAKVLRVYNPTMVEQQTTVTFAKSIERAELITLEEIYKEGLVVVHENTIELTIAPKRIESIKLHF
ncbi:alpha-mannosidase [Sediminitomix flava]|uniref:Mannosylglycerate hydrolase n=1 Tax=Sediminitomix flava TaxID=379075 RepID=A0A315ZE10_SEDFL|nr:glycoside hydrolase family 38 C-terminal domain-containing protein [Sediminitomix flava]PWJ43805.1 mannosylglycerate hydrolase [Sediminitomix flava]